MNDHTTDTPTVTPLTPEEKEKELRERYVRQYQQQMAEKIRRKRIIRLAIAFVVLGIVAFSLIRNEVNHRKNSARRDIGVDQIAAGMTNVHADIVSMEPKYRIIGSPGLEKVVFWCKTENRTGFWLALESSQCPTYFTFLLNDDNIYLEYETLYFDRPVHIEGYITTFEKMADNPPTELKSELVLRTLNAPNFS